MDIIYFYTSSPQDMTMFNFLLLFEEADISLYNEFESLRCVYGPCLSEMMK